ncbi:MAG: hypothetical protein KW788_01600 [Candidatus Doudnabacteria bacterium]|nr:hypothetical protein [Candidatus Doudnabacteria bacterium]
MIKLALFFSTCSKEEQVEKLQINLAQLQAQASELLTTKCISPQGWFYASGDDTTGHGSYKCLFGRDSLHISMFVMDYIRITDDRSLLPNVRRTLEKLADTQGRSFNLETGERPGWIIHEMRTEHHEHLTRDLDPQWPTYDDDVMRIYQSVDSTYLYLIAMYRYWQLTGDDVFLKDILYSVRAAVRAILKFGDTNRDGLLDYFVPPERKSGGLVVWSWTDSAESIGDQIVYPVAPIEVQGYGFLAASLWVEYFRESEPELAQGLAAMAARLQDLTWDKFQREDHLASILDGSGRTDEDVRSSMGHLLWASLNDAWDHKPAQAVVSHRGVEKIVKRLMARDMFDPEGGIRTLSADSPRYDPSKYHNGSIWTHDTVLSYIGLRNHGFKADASLVANGLLTALDHFGTPGMELFSHHQGKYAEFRHPMGPNTGNKVQGWALAGVMAMTAYER